MFRYFFLTLFVLVCPYLIGLGLEYGAKHTCLGWECAEVYCPDGYAVKTPTGYVPCEDLETYLKERGE